LVCARDGEKPTARTTGSGKKSNFPPDKENNKGRIQQQNRRPSSYYIQDIGLFVLLSLLSLSRNPLLRSQLQLHHLRRRQTERQTDRQTDAEVVPFR
jgi:hypothetical protein